MKFKFLKAALVANVFIVSCLVNSASAGLIKLADFDSTATIVDFAGAVYASPTYSDGILTLSGGNVDNTQSLSGLSYSTWDRPNPGVLRLDFSTSISALGMKVHYNNEDVLFRLFDKYNNLIDSSLSSPNQYGSLNGFVGLTTGINNIAYALIDVPKQINTPDLFIDDIIFQRVAEVPEPSTLAIFALGVIGLASRRFKKR